MNDFYKKEAIRIVKAMLKAFFIEKNVDNVLKYVNPDSFTWIGSGEHELLTDIDDIRRHFQARCEDVASAYKMTGEEFITKNSSVDSCIVIAKIKFQGINERKNYESALHFSFYLQLIDGKLLVSHYHVHIPIKKRPFNYSQYFTINNRTDDSSELIQMDFQYQDSLLQQFLLNENNAFKSFLWEEGLPYCYVNQKFLSLVGFKNMKSFMAQESLSSLAHIHPDDQQRYINHLNATFPKSLVLNVQEWKWHASYNIVYRTQTFDKHEKFVLEWGNLFTVNGRPLVNSFVLPLEGNLYPPNTMFAADNDSAVESSSTATLFKDDGVRIGNSMVIYPKHQRLLIKDSYVNLTPIEFKLLMILTEDINNPVDSEKIYKNLWSNPDLKVTSFTLKTHMSNLRQKLKDASDDTIKLTHYKNKGYCLLIPKF